jgi:ABC-2 type transport system ATP-binding protein
MSAISIRQLHKQYKQFPALKNLDFDIPDGSFFGLLGPNGAGKSTLINIIGGLIKPTQGMVSIKGYDVQKQWRQARSLLGVVPQELVYDAFFTVKEVLRLQSGYFGLGRQNEAWLDELLQILSLSDKANTNMFELSGGMKRRTLIAQALVHKPAVVVLDEPTAGVDLELRQMLWKFATRLHDNGHTIVLTTHYLEEAEALCDRIAILNKGELIALEDKNTLINHYPYRLLRLHLAQELINLPSILQAKLQHYADKQLVLRLHRQQDSIAEVLESLRNAGIQFIDLHTEEPGLEEVFMSLTSQAQT